MSGFKRDDIYAQHWEALQPFRFDEAVAQVFPDMIQRSVPGYGLTLAMIGLLAGEYAQPHSICYDLGASLGAASLMMRHNITAPGCRIVAVDNSPAMLRRCRQVIADDGPGIPVDFVLGDIADFALREASVVVLNFTLQFIPAALRASLMERIHSALRPGGICILSEKIQFTEELKNERFIRIHHAYKRANGYSDLEISQKRTALENVLIPETVAAHQERMLAAGFASCDLFFQAFNFISLLAIK
jgi:tRNA (cmo5U34)-methyltransferase